MIVYQSPVDGDRYVPARTTLIVRIDASIMHSRSARDFTFNVFGEKTGAHSGKVLISDDNRTVIFKPYLPFTLNEEVSVKLDFSGVEAITPVCYKFHTTAMSDSEQCYLLNLLRENEKKEIAEFQESKSADQSTNGIPLDTLPPLFPKITIDTLDPVRVAPGNIFLAPSGSKCITIVDNAGTPQFVREIDGGAEDFKMESGNRLSYFKLEKTLPGNIFQGVHYLLNDRFQLIDSFRCGNGYFTDDHDFRLLPNGHTLLIAYDARDTDMRVVTGNPNAAKRATVIGGIIQELDTQKNVVFQWRTWDHLKITDISNFDLTNPNHTTIDYAHLNSVEQDTDGNIIASFRAMDDVVKIKHDSLGKIIWRWGGKDNTINLFTFVGDTLPFSEQHDVRRIANGHITMLDNGDFRKTQWGDGSYHDTSYSRAVEYDLDESTLTATAVWEYRNIPYSFASGNVQRLPNGNTFIGLGAVSIPNAIEVDSHGKKVFQLSLPQIPYNYRAFRFESPPHSSVTRLPGSAYASELRAIYPNPARNAATVNFSGACAGFAQISLINLLGQPVRTLSEEISEGGIYSLTIDVHDLPEGIYYCKLLVNGIVSLKAFIVQR